MWPSQLCQTCVTAVDELTFFGKYFAALTLHIWPCSALPHLRMATVRHMLQLTDVAFPSLLLDVE